MIIKSTTRKQASFRQLLNYLLNKDKSEIGFTLTHNLRGKTIDEWVKEFQQNESFRKHRRSNSVILSHEILSWHKHDSDFINPEVLKELTSTYIQHRNPNGLYVAVAHLEEAKHYHVHIVVSGVEYRSGKSMRMSKQDFAQLKRKMEAYQRERFPRLAFSQVEHGNKRPYAKEKEFQAKRRKQKLGSRERLILLLEEAYGQASSLEVFLKLISGKGIEPYYRAGKLTGVWHGINGNRKYRLNKLGFNVERLALLEKERQRVRGIKRR